MMAIKQLSPYLRTFYEWILPRHCILCDSYSKQIKDLCYDCEKELPWLQNGCEYCGISLLGNELSTKYCGSCLKSPPPFQKTIVLFHYEPPVSRLIIHLKFHHRLIYGYILGSLLANSLENFYKTQSKPDCIMPISLHKKRLRQRGYNQALELARPIAKQLNLKINYKDCQRVKMTAAQSSIPAKKRQKNIRNAFNISHPIPAKHVLVIDDVMTTGFTMREFCLQLRKAGVEKIDVGCIARTGKV